MLRLQDALPKRAQMVAQIHDELLVECKDKDADAVAKIMREQMTKSIPQLPVTLAVKLGAGKSWAEATANQR
jgi:DNA polymerase-1